jgi:hypothetical protein
MLTTLCKNPAHEASAMVKLLIQQKEPERRGRRKRTSRGGVSTLSRLKNLQQDAAIQHGSWSGNRISQLVVTVVMKR